MSSRRRVLIVTYTDIDKASDGKSVVMKNIISFYRSKNYLIRIVSIDGGNKNQDECIRFDRPKPLVILIRLIFRGILQGRPLQSAFFFSSDIKRKINKEAESFAPDILLIDTCRIFDLIEDKFHNLSVVFYDDLYSKRLSDQLRMNIPFSSLGRFSLNSKVFDFFYENLGKHLVRWIVRREIVLTRQLEIYVARNSKRQILLNENEVVQLKQESMSENVVKIRPVFPDANLKAVEVKNQIVFFGALDKTHNTDGLIDFISNEFKRLIESDPSINLVIIGGGAPKELVEIFLNNKNIKYLGYVDDLGRNLQESIALIAPMTFGTGIKIKVIEALSYGLPVITNNVGAEGLENISESGIFYGGNYLDSFKKIKEDRDLYSEMGIKYFSKYYSSSSNMHKYDVVLG
ncbi:glycosyltransferase family 4 protein [Deinococcus sp. 6YEL10]|uniref:glycosyltransferase n=1 Tax=Deinococcus sp. 6YEL10 TaxID=2745870 RepID=UPI001E6256D7|nr:glycosyltransferase [Deinococcus sp. 6YEL10]MCD0160818.1 glycosyltransferase family 4 protein [Deinococcus sp. 6YEL10]